MRPRSNSNEELFRRLYNDLYHDLYRDLSASLNRPGAEQPDISNPLPPADGTPVPLPPIAIQPDHSLPVG